MSKDILIPHYNLKADDETSYIYETSYVANPATGVGFLMFSGDKVEQKDMKFSLMKSEGYQRMTSGVWFMPDVKYLRVDEQGNYYTVSFSKEDLKKALILCLKNNCANVGSLEHGELIVDKFIGIEHWIIEDENTKSPIFGHSLSDLGYDPLDIPVGTVMRTAYVADEEFWNNEIMTGNVTGYSISGMFTLELEDVGSHLNFEKTVHEETPQEVKEEALTVQDGVIETEGASYTVQEGFVVDKEEKTPSEEEFSEVQEVEEQKNDSPIVEEEEEEPIAPVEEEEDMKEDFSAKLEEMQKQIEEYAGKLQEQEKLIQEYRKKLDVSPINSGAQFSKVSSQPLRKITLGGKSVHY